jgi:hypothetical protein
MRCIFCKQDSSSSRSVEHIMPESIGSKKRVLPRGVVCDKCNNYFAREIEEPVLSHPSMRNIRAWHQVPNKRGKLPSLRGHIGGTDVAVSFRRGRDAKLEMEPERLRDQEHVTAEWKAGLPNGFLFLIDMEPSKREMSRFLCKMALETVAETFMHDEGGTEKIVDESYFDNIRTYARYGNNFSEWPYSQRRIYPDTTLMRHPNTKKWVPVGFGCTLFMTKRLETLFAFCFYGTEFVLNVGGPSLRGYEEWLEDHGHISPMVERLGCRLVTEREGQSQRHYLHGDFNVRNGLAFDKLHGYCP